MSVPVVTSWSNEQLRTNSFLIIACIVASFWAWQQDPKFVEQNILFSFNNLMNGRYWTLLSALFVHGSVLHLFGNMLFLFVFGGTLQSSIGAARYLTVFLTGGLSGFVLSLPFVDPNAGMVGASAAIFTVAHTLLVKPLPYVDAERIVMLTENNLPRGWASFWPAKT